MLEHHLPWREGDEQEGGGYECEKVVQTAEGENRVWEQVDGGHEVDDGGRQYKLGNKRHTAIQQQAQDQSRKAGQADQAEY